MLRRRHELALLAALLAALGPPSAGAAGLLTCFPDRPVVHPGETVKLRALASAGAGQPRAVRVRWSVPEGKVEGGDPARWRLGSEALPDGMPRRTLTATATIGSAGSDPATCRLQVMLARPAKPAPSGPVLRGSGGWLSSRALLEGDAKVPRGYGSISYLLLATQPKDAAARDRALRAIAAWLMQLPRSQELERYRPRSQINLSLLPVTEEVDLPEAVTEASAALKAAELLKVYNFARARHLLATLGQEAQEAGPYLIARPSGDRSAALVLDMSRAAPQLAWDWVSAFCALASQERSWNQVALQKLALHTRNFLAIATRDAAEVAQELGNWVKLVPGPG